MNSADFNYSMIDAQGRNIVSIIDLDLGNKSVTNDIENVVEKISLSENINLDSYMIVYRDSEGKWDGWDSVTKDFIALSADTYDEAVRKYILKQITTM